MVHWYVMSMVLVRDTVSFVFVSVSLTVTTTNSSLGMQRRLSVRYEPSDLASSFPTRPNSSAVSWPFERYYLWYPYREWWTTTTTCSTWGSDATPLHASYLTTGTRIFCPNPFGPDYHYLSCTWCLIAWGWPWCRCFSFEFVSSLIVR